MARRKGNLAALVKLAQNNAEASAVDDKYKLALFYYFLTRSGEATENIGARAGQSVRKIKEAEEKGKDRASAPASIRSLYDDNFFKDGKTIQETSDRLAKDGYHFGYEATKKALQRATFLRAEGEKRNRKFFQRHPPK